MCLLLRWSEVGREEDDDCAGWGRWRAGWSWAGATDFIQQEHRQTSGCNWMDGQLDTLMDVLFDGENEGNMEGTIGRKDGRKEGRIGLLMGGWVDGPMSWWVGEFEKPTFGYVLAI